MSPAKKCACIGVLVMLCSSFSSASRILMDQSPDNGKMEGMPIHKIDDSPTTAQGVGYGYGHGGGVGPGGGTGYGYGSGSGGSGVGYGAGGGNGVGYGVGSGTGGGTGVGQGSSGGYSPGTGIGYGYGSGSGGGTGIGEGSGGGGCGSGVGQYIPGTGIGIGTGGGTVQIPIGGIPGIVVPGVSCIPGVSCPDVPACDQPGTRCNQPVSGCTPCGPHTGWKAQSGGEATKELPHDRTHEMAKEPGELMPLPDEAREMQKEVGEPLPPNMPVNSTNSGHESAVDGFHH